TGSVPASGNTTNVSFQITTNSTLTWLWRVQSELIQFTVVSTNASGVIVGNPQPPQGTTNVAYNSARSASVTSPWTVSSDERAEILGYVGTGDAPTGNGGLTPMFQTAVDSTLRWNWKSKYLLRKTLFKSGTSDGDVQISPPGTPEGTPVIGYWYDSGTVVTLTPLPAVGSVFSGWSGDVTGFGIKTVTMTNKMSVTASFRDVIPGEIPEAWLTKYGLDPNDPNVSWEDPDNDGLSNLQEYWVSHVYASNTAGYVECSPINADSDGDSIDDGYEFFKILAPGVTNGVPGSQKNFMAVVDVHGANGPDGNPDGDFHWSTRTGYKTDIGLTTGEEYVGPDGIAPGSFVTLTNIPGVSKPVKAFCYQLGLATNSLYYLASPDTGDQSSSDSTDSEIAGFDGKSGDGFDDGFEYSWDLWQSMNEDSAAGDPLGHRIPYHANRKPELPTSALIGPWFHPGSVTNDIAISLANYDRVSLYVNIGGGFLIPTNDVDLPPGSAPVAMAMGAFDVGVTNDIVVACSNNNTVCVLLRAPSNTIPFTVASYAAGVNPSFVTVGRFNNDAFQDIAVANSGGGGTVSVLTNDGAGVFALMTTLAVGGNPSSVAAGRIFGSITNAVPTPTLSDLLVSDGITNVLAFRCNTNNTFTLVSTTPVGAIPCTVVLSDFNLDNTNDFAVALTGDSLVKTYLGDGAGGFTLKGSATVGAKGYPVHLAGGDLNYSTDPFSGKTVPSNPIDLVASAYSNRTGRLFMGLPSGSLVGASAIDLAMRPVWSVVGDLTQDGLNDILFVCKDDDKISMWKGDGSGSFDFIANYGSSASSVGRPFNPAVVHDPPPGTGFPDYDLIYLPKGGVGNWFSDDLEYNAWSTNTIMYSLTSNTIVRLDYPNTPRSTNPFLWDTDGDGLPDGWEVVFGYDPWKKISFGGTVSDDKLNPDLDGHAMMKVITSIVGGVTNGNVLYDHDVYAYKPLYPNDDPYPPNGNTFANNFNPNTGWLDPRGKALNPPGIADTEAYANKLEMLGGRSRPAVMPYDPKDHSSNPRLRDTDGDGIWDGWELYVGLNPIDPIDAYPPRDDDRDGLCAWQEFMCLDTLLAEPSWILTNGVLVVPGNLTPEQQALISQRALFVAGWQNKTRPTDPGNRDTDDDQIGDGAERTPFNYSGGLAVPVLISDTNAIGDVTDLGVYAEGGGLTPTACDTDNDGLPDFWESSYAGGLIGTNGVWGGGMDGSRPDAFLDYDGDGLLNYQEYMTGSIYHWQYMYNNGSTAWTYGRGSWGYEPFDFFDDQRSATPAHPNGDAMFGPGGRRPKPWDAHFWSNKKLGKPFNFLTAAEPTPLPWMFSTADPGNADSDEDGMDDYWETYHMLNPLLGGLYGPLRDLVYEKATGFRPNYPFPPPPPDIINCPWVNGRVEMDWDQDGLPNIYESVQPQCPVPGYYHTDPSPYWLSDWSYNQSFTDLYYWSGFNFGILNWWYWNGTVIKDLPYYGPDFAPNYMFDFETNDGFDTDNDNLPDRAELVDTDASPGSTDPLDSGDPIKQRALYLNGQAAARTYSPTTVNAWAQLREFTVEAWVRPQKPASGTEQVIIERAVGVANGNPLGYPSSIRANFRVGLDPDGRPFVGYHGAGFDPIFEECKTDISGALHPDEWAHLAGVYDGTAKKLILYVNGIMAAMKPTAEIPFNSWYGGAPSNPDIFNNPSGPFSSPLTIGARENNPIAWVDGVQFNVTCLAGLWAGANLRRQDPQLDHYFKGWVDEVHVFSGSTPQSTIVSRMKKRWTHQSVWAYNASVPITNAMMWAYSFDDIQDPDYGGVAPAGFDLLTGYMPGNVGIPWWMKAPDVSRVYTDYRYVPWIENLVDHVPLNPAADSSIPWNAATNAFPNSANPYTFDYRTATDVAGEWHPKSSGSFSGSGDLLPLRWAVADEDVLMWDNSNSRLPRDSDGDGLPDDWEVAHGLDPRTGDGINGADGDPDGDGLSNFYEYLCGTDPWSVDSNGNGIWDMDEDSDGDGLSNREELRRLTLPNDKDTDDDGVSDWEEVTGSTDPAFDASRPATSRRPNGMTDPLNPLEPLIPRSMMFNGNARVLVPPSNKLMSRDWTVEMWVRPATNCNGGVLLSRYVKGLSAGQEGITYELGLSTNDIAVGVIRAYTRYAQTTNSVVVETRVDGTGATETLSPSQGVLIPLDKWTHLAGVHDSKTDTLALYVNGNLAAHRTDASAVPPTVYGYTVSHRGDEVTIGASRSTGAITNAFTGLLDEVRIWNVAKSAKDIGDRYNAPQAVASAASASASITLKNRTIPTTEGVSAEVAALPASQPTRLLVQFESSAVAGNSNALQAAGIKTLNYVSPTVRMVSATPAQLTALGHTVRWGGLLRPTDKLSSLLAVDGSHTNRQVLVKFFNDTAQTEAVQAVQAAGGTVYQNRYLGGHYLVATVNDAQLTALVGGNAVAWASPAAAFLTSGGPVHYFGDDIMKNGLEAAPFVTVGEGWDGPGRGSASLQYFFVNDTTKLTPSVARQAVVDQFAKISAVAALTFAETTVPAQAYSIDIAWYRGAHGDGADFDGPFGVLAHGFFPNDINPEPIAGDLHFDEDETWSIGSAGGIDIQYVGLHEIGHCVGLGHSADPGAVMYPFYDGSRAAVLAKDDIDALQSIYGEAQSLAEFRFDDGGVLAQDFSVKNDWLSGWASAAVLDGAVFWTNSTPFLDKDTDGDGMPDWWEIG
ncbi:MAG: matrixin family metalloprotease, partial [bacterium]